MKKILSILSLALVALAFVSCSKNSPEGVVEQYFSYMKNGDYEKVIDICYFKRDLSDKDKEQLVSLIRDKQGKVNDEKGGLKSLEITNVEMSEDGNSAKVSYTQTYGNGETKDSDGDVVLVDGKWMLDSGK